MDLKPKCIAFLLYDECDMLDTIGPAEVFDVAARNLMADGIARVRAYELQYFSPAGGLVTTRQQLKVLTAPLPTPGGGEFDTLIVVGGKRIDENCDPRLVDWLREHHRAFRRIASVCRGSFILALAGLLDGRRATTHWEDCSELQRRFPNLKVSADCIFTEDGGIFTSAGVSTGIDLALALLEQDHGHDLALLVAQLLVLPLKRPGGETQFSTALRAQAVTGPLAALLTWIADNPGADLRAEALAERANMSLRNFYRAFVEATGGPPAEWVEAVRLEVAKRLLEQTPQNADQIAFKSGFGSYERMRRTFTRRLGVSPTAYRSGFAHVLDAPISPLYLGTLNPVASAFESTPPN